MVVAELVDELWVLCTPPLPIIDKTRYCRPTYNRISFKNNLLSRKNNNVFQKTKYYPVLVQFLLCLCGIESSIICSGSFGWFVLFWWNIRNFLPHSHHLGKEGAKSQEPSWAHRRRTTCTFCLQTSILSCHFVLSCFLSRVSVASIQMWKTEGANWW